MTYLCFKPARNVCLLQTSIASLVLLYISLQDSHAVLLHMLTCCLSVIHILMYITHMLYGEQICVDTYDYIYTEITSFSADDTELLYIDVYITLELGGKNCFSLKNANCYLLKIAQGRLERWLVG